MSPLKPEIINFITRSDFSHAFESLTAAAARTGYIQLTAGVLTVIPPIVCLIAGLLLSLNPFAVLIICLSGKILRVAGMILAMRYIKISILGIKNYWEHRHDAKNS